MILHPESLKSGDSAPDSVSFLKRQPSSNDIVLLPVEISVGVWHEAGTGNNNAATQKHELKRSFNKSIFRYIIRMLSAADNYEEILHIHDPEIVINLGL